MSATKGVLFGLIVGAVVCAMVWGLLSATEAFMDYMQPDTSALVERMAWGLGLTLVGPTLLIALTVDAVRALRRRK